MGTAVLLGLAVLLLACLEVSRLLQSYVFGIKPWGAVSLAAAVALVCGVTLLACLTPTRRALRLPPALALREE